MFSFMHRLSRYSSIEIAIQCFHKKPTLVRSIATIANSASTNHNSFTISYLINSCGLSPLKAISASKYVQFETSAKPDLVIDVFRNHEISNAHISKIIQAIPAVLLYDANKILKPKIDFFKSLGLSSPELSKILSANPRVLLSSLEKKIIPSFAFLKSLVHTDTNMILLLKRSTWVLSTNNLQLQEVLLPKINVLRSHGVPENNITMMLLTQPRALLCSNDKFTSVAQEVIKIGIDPSKYMFCEGIRRLVSISESIRNAKIGVFKKWGWSEDEIYAAFRREPNCFGLSEETIMLKMDFLVNKMGYDPLLIAQYPAVLKYNLDKRIIPRGGVIQILISKGLLEKSNNLYSIYVVSGEDFLDKFVFKYDGEVTELMNAYRKQGK